MSAAYKVISNLLPKKSLDGLLVWAFKHPVRQTSSKYSRLTLQREPEDSANAINMMQGLKRECWLNKSLARLLGERSGGHAEIFTGPLMKTSSPTAIPSADFGQFYLFLFHQSSTFTVIRTDK